MTNFTSEEQVAVDFYAKCRSQIEHEDDLVNQRLSWLMMLQGFLFTAYGFSMSAEAASLGARALDATSTESAKQAWQVFSSNLTSVRYGLVILGILSSLAALIGVLAAFRAIKDYEKDLSDFPSTATGGKKLFPKIIGGRTTNVMGMTCGIVMPFLTSGGWIWVGNLQGVQFQFWVGTLIVALLLTLFFVFFKLRVGVR